MEIVRLDELQTSRRRCRRDASSPNGKSHLVAKGSEARYTILEDRINLHQFEELKPFTFQICNIDSTHSERIVRRALFKC